MNVNEVMDNNLEVRIEVLRYSLILEDMVNKLLLFNLGIYDGGHSTRLFSNKAGLTFKNKIDLLYDINVFSKEENADLELLMIFRNKFLHDINSNTFSDVIGLLDRSIQNRFKANLDEGESIYSEESCRTACGNLYYKNVQTIRLKIAKARVRQEKRHEIFDLHTNIIVSYIDIFFNLVSDLTKTMEKSQLEQEEVRNLVKNITKKCNQYADKFTKGKKVKEYNKKLSKILSDPDNVKDFFGVNRAPADLIAATIEQSVNKEI